MRLDEGANVEELVNGLHAIGTTARDVVAILQAIKAEVESRLSWRSNKWQRVWF